MLWQLAEQLRWAVILISVHTIVAIIYISVTTHVEIDIVPNVRDTNGRNGYRHGKMN
jgi:hypothetical protein